MIRTLDDRFQERLGHFREDAAVVDGLVEVLGSDRHVVGVLQRHDALEQNLRQVHVQVDILQVRRKQ